MGGIAGFEVGNLSGFDIKATDDSLFAIFKFNELSKNIEDSIFEKLSKDARIFKNAKFYLVDFTIENRYMGKWILGNDEYSVSHKNVFIISGHSFYDVLSETDEAFKKLEAAILTIPNEIKIEK